MGIQNHVETVIDRPIQEVFEEFTDFSKLPRWDTGVISIERQGEGPDSVGTIWTHRRKVGSRVITAPIEITEHDPPRRIAHVSASGPVTVRVTLAFEAEGNATRVVEDLEMEVRWPLKIIQSRMARQTVKSASETHENFKRYMESR